MNILEQVQNLPVHKENIGYGDSAIMRTVSRMRRIIHLSSANPYVRRWAQQVLGDVEVQDKYDEVESIHNFVRDNIRYTSDPRGIEFVQTPPVLLEGIRYYLEGRQEDRPIGDCDDMTTLSLSLMKSVGYATAIKVVGFRGSPKYSHVYGLVFVNGKWLVSDTVRPDKYFEWEASGITRAKETKV